MSTQEFSLIRYLDEKSEAYITFGGFIMFTGTLEWDIDITLNLEIILHFLLVFQSITWYSRKSIHGGPNKMSSINLSFGRAIKSKKMMKSLSKIIPLLIDDYMILNLGVVLSYNDSFDSKISDSEIITIIEFRIRIIRIFLIKKI